MSWWRREASERLPELQRTIASQDVKNPMMLWLELDSKFEQLCASDAHPLDLLKRIWKYSQWCLEYGSEDVQTASALGFCGHLIDTPQKISLLPKIMQRSDFINLRSLLEYHHSSESIDAVLNSAWPKSVH